MIGPEVLRRHVPAAFVATAAVIFLALAVVSNSVVHANQQYLALATAFLEGKLYLLDFPDGAGDTVVIAGRHFWPLGPLPAVLLIPFVVFGRVVGITLWQGYLHAAATLSIFASVYYIARRLRYGTTDALTFAFAFCFASLYAVVAFLSWSWYLAQVVATALVLFAMREYLGRSRAAVIGIFLGLTFLARPTAAVAAAAFFLFAAVTDDTSWRHRMQRLSVLVLPLAVAGLIFVGYNVARFGSPMATGYDRLTQWSPVGQATAARFDIFQLRYVPTNLYHYFLKLPEPMYGSTVGQNGDLVLEPPYFGIRRGYPGASLFVLTPVLLFAFRASTRNRLVRLSLVAIAAGLPLLLTYYSSASRIGPRYLIDLLPFAFLALMAAFPERRLPRSFAAVAIISACLNLYLLLSAFLPLGWAWEGA